VARKQDSQSFFDACNRSIDAIKKHGHLDDYKKAAWVYEKAKKAVESTRAGLALLEESGENVKKLSKKKTKEGKKEAPAKAPEPKSAAKEAEVAPAVNDDMKVASQVI
jgi:hypothetical protein